MSPSYDRIAQVIRMVKGEAEDRSDKSRKRARNQREQRQRQQTSLVIFLVACHLLPDSTSMMKAAKPL
jgi:hypothetical protein